MLTPTYVNTPSDACARRNSTRAISPKRERLVPLRLHIFITSLPGRLALVAYIDDRAPFTGALIKRGASDNERIGTRWLSPVVRGELGDDNLEYGGCRHGENGAKDAQHP